MKPEPLTLDLLHIAVMLVAVVAGVWVGTALESTDDLRRFGLALASGAAVLVPGLIGMRVWERKQREG